MGDKPSDPSPSPQRRPWEVPGRPVFLTWRLHGSPVSNEPLSTGADFARFDRLCDTTPRGPHWLGQTEIAQLFIDALRHGEGVLQRYRLHAWVVMPNHVHLLIHPLEPLPEVARTLKGFTARQANLALGRTGQPFWQSRSFDRWVRNDHEIGRIVRFIETNPVRAGLAQAPELWPWSSATAAVGQPASPKAVAE